MNPQLGCSDEFDQDWTHLTEGPSAQEALEFNNPVRYPFRLTTSAVEYAKEDRDGSIEWLFVSSRLEVAAITRSEASEDWGRLLVFKDLDGKEHSWAMPMESLAGDGVGYRERLLSMGLIIAPGNAAKARLHQYIATTEARLRVRAVCGLGWHYGAFVLPDHVFGSTDGERVLYQSTSSIDHAFRTSGTLDEWRKEVAPLCVGNSRLSF